MLIRNKTYLAEVQTKENATKIDLVKITLRYELADPLPVLSGSGALVVSLDHLPQLLLQLEQYCGVLSGGGEVFLQILT